MPAVPPYIPAKDANLANWSANFAALITANPTLYGLTSVDAGIIQGVSDDFAAKYAIVTSPATKTPAAVSDKNTSKVVLLQTVRPYAQNVALNAGVSSSDKIALGLNPRTSTPSPVTAPASNPVLTVQSASNLSVVLRYRDSAASVSVKAKPYGAIACEVFAKASATPITDPTALPWVQTATKSPFVVALDPADIGKQLYVAARWKTRKGEFSPWSGIISVTVTAVA
jgi:hypothetical protein